MFNRIMRRIRHELTTPPEKLFPLRPALPVPQGISEKELFEFVTTVQWFELVFRESYLINTLKNKGWQVRKYELLGNPIGTTLVCRIS